jgi:demethylmacrocin O-methyltransferase
MKSINDIFVEYGTDKSNVHNGYSVHYENNFEHLKNEKIKLLEIGIFRPPSSWVECQVAASLKSWKQYFKNGLIIGVDIEDFSDVNEDRIETMIINQENREDLKKIIEKYNDNFDIIIDDGGHKMSEQQISFGFLFKMVKSGGIYVIEDLITSSYDLYRGYNPTETKNTTLKVLEDLKENSNFISDFMNQEEIDYIKENTDKVIIENGNKGPIAFIYKK